MEKEILDRKIRDGMLVKVLYQESKNNPIVVIGQIFFLLKKPFIGDFDARIRYQFKEHQIENADFEYGIEIETERILDIDILKKVIR